MSTTDVEARPLKPKRVNRTSVVLAGLLIVAIAASGFFYVKYQQATQPTQSVQEQILAEIGRVLLLPDEVPTSFQVASKSKLTNQALASRVEDGDTLFMYSNANKLLVYRPSLKKVVEVLRIDNSSEVSSTPLP